jgi:hypothetical protein
MSTWLVNVMASLYASLLLLVHGDQGKARGESWKRPT